MLAVDLFCGEAFIRLCIRVTNPTSKKAEPSVAYPDLAGGGGGIGHPDPEMRGGGVVSKKFFSALRASFWSKNKGGPRAPRAPPLDPPLALQLPKSTSVTVEPGIRCSVRTRCQHFSVHLLRCWLNLAVSVYFFSISIFCYNSVACDTRRYTYNPISSV